MTKRATSLVVVFAALSVASVTLLASRQSTGRPTFAVTSIKRAAPPAGGAVTVRPGASLPGGRWLASNATLQQIIAAAYRGYAFPDGRIIGGPEWIIRERFEIDARADGTPPPDQVELMLRSLLADRFQLRVHEERRDFEIYALVLARGDGRLGPQLRTQAIDCASVRATVNRNESSPRTAAEEACRQRSERLPDGTVRIRAAGLSIDGGLTTLLGRLDRPVVDRTGLAGLFDFELRYVPQAALQATAGPIPDGPSIFTAVQEQLGLRLEPRREPLDVLVIDSVEMPTPD